MSLEHLNIPNSKAALKDCWGHAKRTQRPHKEVLLGKERTFLTFNKDKNCNDLKRIRHLIHESIIIY